jgi:hypothetical protein
VIYIVRPAAPTEVVEAFEKRGPRDGKTEIEKAREYYAQIPAPTKAYGFTRYKEMAVCRALDDLFFEKCAYCESSYRAVDSRDVEHYRPKGGITESPQHHGYWWLAAVWHNLLPSCPPCNQARYHTVFDPGMTLEEFERARRQKPNRLSGKANSFPVKGDNWVTSETGDITAEDPLLINPCERDPANHLEFVFDWKSKPQTYIWEADAINALVRPKLKNGVEDAYGKASIAIYGLNRAGLVRERASYLRLLQLLCKPIVDLADELMHPPSAADLTQIRDRHNRYKADLTKLCRPNEPYAGMTRAFVLQFEQELDRLATAT